MTNNEHWIFENDFTLVVIKFKANNVVYFILDAHRIALKNSSTARLYIKKFLPHT
jgi:hypothetical protein